MNDETRKKHALRFSYIFYLFIVGNLVFLDYWMVVRKPQYTLSQIRTVASLSQNVPSEKPGIDEAALKDLCGDDCVKAIYKELEEATKSSRLLTADVCRSDCIQEMYRLIEEASAASKKQPAVGFAPTQALFPTQKLVKEVYIPIGSGNSSAGEWSDVPGLQIVIDTANYPGIKQAVFEAILHIPTGNQAAFVRMYNVTDSHPVWFSELTLEGGTPALLTSGGITLDTGSKTYRVQMKTSLKYQANIEQARIKLSLQ